MLTILFSTYNGMRTLPRMLERLREIQRPEYFRIVAVDNRSDDGSYESLVRASRDLPITLLHCPYPGKNRALNFALDQIADTLDDQGLVVVTDDDILPEDDWLLQLSRAAIAHPQANVFGGVIRPVWPVEVPDWLPQLEGVYPVLFATTTARHGACDSRQIYGPNMAVRGKLFKRGLRFNPDIGPDGTQKFGMGSESELLRRLEREGHRMFFCAHAIVGHQIKASLLRWNSVLSRARRYGLGLGKLDGQERNLVALFSVAAKRALIAEAKTIASLLPRYADRRRKLLFWREVERGRLKALISPALNRSPSASVLAGIAGLLGPSRLTQLAASLSKPRSAPQLLKR